MPRTLESPTIAVAKMTAEVTPRGTLLSPTSLVTSLETLERIPSVVCPRAVSITAILRPIKEEDSTQGQRSRAGEETATAGDASTDTTKGTRAHDAAMSP